MYRQTEKQRNIITITQLNRLARSILESEIGQVWLSAEISNFVAASSGHWYFTLKDNKAQIKAAMFRGANMRVKVRPKEGDKMLVRASVGIYEARGDFQAVVDFMEPDGEGILKQQFEQLKIKLSAEGLFSASAKQPIPKHIKTVGVITSATGAALHDVLTVLKRRNPSINVIIYPSQVQGDMAARQLCTALNNAFKRNEVDVIIIGRGGGSLEDLWCFNDERLARTMVSSPIPVISAVGHEIDVTIADFVADVRAPTPSAAAEIVSQNSQELFEKLSNLRRRLKQTMGHYLQQKNHRLQLSKQNLRVIHPQNQIHQQQQHVDNLQQKLSQQIEQRLNKHQYQSQTLHNTLMRQSPINRINNARQHGKNLESRLNSSVQNVLGKKQYQWAKAAELLDSVSPLATLARGYSITHQKVDGDEKHIIKSVQKVSVGDIIETQLHDGMLVSKVTKSTR